MDIKVNTNSINSEVILSVVIGCVVLLLILYVTFQLVKGSDNKKALERKFGKIIEKTTQQSSYVYWVTVDFEDGTRKKMRVFDKNLILAIGDQGIIEYQGQTIRAIIRKN